MTYGIMAADQIQSSVTGVSIGPGNATNFKNRIINGAMVIDQRSAGANTSVQTTNTYVTCDRWNVYASQNSKFTIGQNSTTTQNITLKFY